MTSQQKTYTWIIVAVVLVAIIVFWKNISKAIGISVDSKPLDGTACKTEDGKDGIYASGVCAPTGGPRPNGSGSAGETERVRKTHCVSRQPGTQCQPRIYVGGHWFLIDPSKTNANTCCYTMIN